MGYSCYTCKNRADSDIHIWCDKYVKDIKQLYPLEGEEGHSEAHKNLCNCAANYIIFITLFT